MRTIAICSLVLCTSLPLAAPAQIEITSFDHTGVLEWSNSLANVSTFDVEWAGPLREGVWRASWDGLAGIPATTETYRVNVPACFRVVANTNTLRSRWTLLFYLIADNDLEPDFVTKFGQLSRWSSDTNVQLVVQFARNGQDDRYGSWRGCERYYVTNGIVPTQGNAIQDWGDGTGGRLVNMADPDTLSDFLDWAIARYPADHYALLIGDHGFGWNGFGICWSYAKSIMYISDLRAVLQASRAPMDCLLLDACHMNMVELVAEMRDTGLGYLLASETYGQTDWPYGWMLEGLQANPQWTPLAFITDVNDRLWDYYSVSNVVPKITLCTTDLSLAPGLVSNATLFVAGVRDTNVLLTVVQDRARAVMTSITNTLIIRHLGSDWDDIAFGLAVFFPLKDGLYAPASFDEYTARRTAFANETGWRAMMEAYYDPMSHPPYHAQLNGVRAAMTNYLDYGNDEHIDLYDFCRRFAEAPP